MDFEKDLYKRMEKLWKIYEIRSTLISWDVAKKLIARSSFAKAKIFDHDLAAIQLHKTNLKLNRPVYVGMSILDLSKHLMYGFYYNHFKANYGHECDLLYTDTDSLSLNIRAEDVYADMAEDKDLYDFSNYPKNHSLHSDVNKKVIGKMKHDSEGVPISEFVGLRPKMYSILLSDEES